MDELQNESFLKRNAIWVVVLIALAVFGFILFKGWDKIVNEEIDGKMSTFTGNFSCLPLKADSKSTDDKCHLGIRSKDGLYYALDVSHIQDVNSDLKANDNIAATGTLKPQGDVALSEWSNYKIEGIILVNTLLRTR